MLKSTLQMTRENMTRRKADFDMIRKIANYKQYNAECLQLMSRCEQILRDIERFEDYIQMTEGDERDKR